MQVQNDYASAQESQRNSLNAICTHSQSLVPSCFFLFLFFFFVPVDIYLLNLCCCTFRHESTIYCSMDLYIVYLCFRCGSFHYVMYEEFRVDGYSTHHIMWEFYIFCTGQWLSGSERTSLLKSF